MGRPRKEGKYVTYKLNEAIIDLIDKYSEETGIPKTRIVEDALSEHFCKLGLKMPDRNTKMLA